jgi:hypothetical protein
LECFLGWHNSNRSPAEYESHKPNDKEDKKQNLRDSYGRPRDPTEAENGSDDGDYQEYE